MEHSIKGNEVAVLASPRDCAAFVALCEAPDTVQAMACDGIEPETIRVYIVDNVWEL